MAVSRACNQGQGLSRSDTDLVLQLLQQIKEAPDMYTLTDMASYDTFCSNLLRHSGDGWQESTVTVTSDDVPTLRLSNEQLKGVTCRWVGLPLKGPGRNRCRDIPPAGSTT